MLKKLNKQEMKLYWIDERGDKHEGLHSWLSGNVSGIRGDVSGIRGDVSGLKGNVSGIRGDVSGLMGNVSWLSGNVDDCQISDDERKKGIDINDLIEDGKDNK